MIQSYLDKEGYINYALEIKKANVPVHLDLEHEITLKKNGLLTFTVRVNNGSIVDFNVTEYVSALTYLGLKGIAYTELVITSDLGGGDETNALRDDNG